MPQKAFSEIGWSPQKAYDKTLVAISNLPGVVKRAIEAAEKLAMYPGTKTKAEMIKALVTALNNSIACINLAFDKE